MRAFALQELGRSGSVIDVPEPEPAEGQVRIRLAAAGLNPFDNAVIQGYLKDRMEHRFPLIPGADASGTVEALGEGVIELSLGDEVFGSVGKRHLGEGTFAEFATMSTGTIARKPASIDHTDAAAIPVAGVTALTMIETASVSDGDVVVVIGATGGVGSYLVQLAAKRGARVLAICSAKNADYARKLGAAEVIDYEAGDVVEAVRSLAPDGVDVIAELHGGDDTARLAELVRSGGRVVSAVGGADEETLKARGIEAANIMGMVATEPLELLAGMLERGEIVSPEIRTYPLAEAAAAFEQVASGHTRGKIVVTP
ncbi:MAG TPA: NADP-dependent oxidoreductase [Actinomycetota bacterium]|nr:NADP-dependent oxidoreductase [Actinomycetota bacterium]